MLANMKTRSLRNSNNHFQKARTRLPLGVSSSFRYWGDDQTIYIKRGKGGRIWDVDDNAYIDYRLGYGPAILGYADPRVDEAAIEGMRRGGVFALGTELEYEVAERIHRMVPAAELVRFSNSGTEAVMAALRVARGFTGRDAYIIVEGSYHGLFDAAMWQVNMDDWDGKSGEPELQTYGDGVPKQLSSLVHFTPLNDLNRLEEIFRRHGDQVAAFLVEPIMGNCCALTASVEFLRTARALCDRYGVLMLIDEVKTGFRVAKGGVQELFGVHADLCTFAKAMGNGYPIAAFGGRADIMRIIETRVKHGGTYTAHSVSLAAANKTLQILEETDALANIKTYGLALQAAITKVLNDFGIAHCYTGHPSMGGLFFRREPPTNYRDWKSSDYNFYDTLAPFLHELGVLVEPDSREPWFICEAHDKACLDETVAAFRRGVAQTLEYLASSQSQVPA